MPHIGAQRRDQRREAAPPQRQRVERRQAPILAGAAQRVGRRADRRPRRRPAPCRPRPRRRSDWPRPRGRDRARSPGRPRARGRRAARAGDRPAIAETGRTRPGSAVAGEFGDLGRARVAHRRRPGVPGKLAALLQEMLVQRLENGEVGQSLPARLAETARKSSASAPPASISARRKRSNSASSTGRLTAATAS